MAYTRPMAMLNALLDALRGEGAPPEPVPEPAIDPTPERPRVALRERSGPPEADESVPQDYWAGWPYHSRGTDRPRVRYRRPEWGEKRPRRCDVSLTRRPVSSGNHH